MTDETYGRKRFQLRGWREICEFLQCKDKGTAKKMLKRMGILCYDGNKPILNTMLYDAVIEKVDDCKYRKVSKSVINNLVLKLISTLESSQMPSTLLRLDDVHICLPKRNKEKIGERGDKQYLQWRSQVLKRDGYRCKHCGSEEYLNVHHIELFSKNEKLRTEINNGLTLCVVCHRGIHFPTKEKKI